MKRYLVCAAIILSGSMQCASAADALEQSLKQAKILPPEYAFRITHKDADAIVQTYERPNATQSDLKIDAVLIARIITEKLPDVAKVKVLFFKHDRSSYYQIAVTVGDIKAFGGGDVSKEKLLKSLEVVQVTTNEPAPAAAAKAGVFKDHNFSFLYPQTWTFIPPNDSSSLGELKIAGTQDWAVITMRRQPALSAEQQAAFDEDYSLKNSHTVVRKGRVAVGRRRASAMELLTSGFDNGQKDKPRYQQHMYFGPAGNILSITMQYSPADAHTLNALFAKLLNTVSF
jgi:hypothetical protein